MSRVNHVADTDRPQERRAAVGLSPDPLVVLDHLNGGGGGFHRFRLRFLAVTTVNVRAMMDRQILSAVSPTTPKLA